MCFSPRIFSVCINTNAIQFWKAGEKNCHCHICRCHCGLQKLWLTIQRPNTILTQWVNDLRITQGEGKTNTSESKATRSRNSYLTHVSWFPCVTGAAHRSMRNILDPEPGSHSCPVQWLIIILATVYSQCHQQRHLLANAVERNNCLTGRLWEKLRGSNSLLINP